MGQPVVTIKFDAAGTREFTSVTSQYAPGGSRNPNPNTYRQLAIVLDGQVRSAPVIREPIVGGRAEISGRFTLAEATLLANAPDAGALPLAVGIVSEGRISE
jgi:preprotein translocase subunit SecD